MERCGFFKKNPFFKYNKKDWLFIYERVTSLLFWRWRDSVKSLKKMGDFIPTLLEDRMRLRSCQTLSQCQARQLQLIWHHSGHVLCEIVGYCWREPRLAAARAPLAFYCRWHPK